MTKKVGLSRAHKKMLEFKTNNSSKTWAALLYHQSKSYFRVFTKSFGNGYEIVKTKPHGQLIEIANQDITANLIVFHFAVELILKALLTLNTNLLHEDDENHNLKKLLEKVTSLYPQAKKILTNKEYELLLQELGENHVHIRYAQGSLCLRNNSKRGWPNKKPVEELKDALYDIYQTLLSIFEEEKLKITASTTPSIANNFSLEKQ